MAVTARCSRLGCLPAPPPTGRLLHARSTHLLLILLSCLAHLHAAAAHAQQPAPATCASSAAADAGSPADFGLGTSVQVFYYLWYGDPKTDGEYVHWNHEILPHWNAEVARQYPTRGRFHPPDNLHCPFYPKLGPYSSSDPDVILAHMRQLREAGVNVLVVSWWGPHWREGTHDTQVCRRPQPWRTAQHVHSTSKLSSAPPLTA
jgi:hypothetical protein